MKKPILILVLGAPVGFVAGAGVGAAICFAYAWREERRMERNGL